MVNILNRYTSAVIATIAGSTLAGIVFSGMNLTNADLSNVDLSGSTFQGANVSGSTFENSNLTGTSFFRSNVEGADFRGTTLSAATNLHACFMEETLWDAPLDDITNWFLAFFYGGQSNCVSIASGTTVGLPDASIPFFYDVVAGSTSAGLWGPLKINPQSGDHGAEVVMLQTLKGLGLDVGMAKVARGATTMSDWASTSAAEYATVLAPGLKQAVNQLQTIRPGQPSRWLCGWYLGEDDSRADGSGASLYGQNFISMMIGISGLLSANVWKRFTAMLMPTWLANQVPNSIFNVRYWQTALSYNTLNTNALAHMGDNVHLTAAGQDALGALWATAAQSLIAAQTT
jgi:uncharacterized protein YjbI with pentapeptide repeats